jgi:hypothetical protein
MKSIEEMIKASLEELKKIGNECDRSGSKQTSKLIYPKKRNNDKRISEQEARLLLIRELEKQDDWYYSVETPTSKLYCFSNKDNPRIVGEGALSARFDITLYDKMFERKHFIEFKNENVKTVKKDFLKLICDENDRVNYFINVVYKDDLSKRNTLKSIKEKYQEAVDYIKKEYSEHNSTLKIFLFNIKDGELIQFKDINPVRNTTIEDMK